MGQAFKNLSIGQLRVLLTLLEVRNLSHAATRLGTSQSALSRGSQFPGPAPSVSAARD